MAGFYNKNTNLEKQFLSERQLMERTIGNKLFVLGSNCYGQLGTNNTTSCLAPISPSSELTWSQVCVYGRYSMATKNDGTLWTWGLNNFGSLGDGSTISKSSPVQTVACGTNWSKISLGFGTAAIKKDGTLWTWGPNANCQLGDGTNVTRSSPVQTLSGGVDWKHVNINSASAAAIKTDGSLWAWGYNYRTDCGSDNIDSPTQIYPDIQWRCAVSGNSHGLGIDECFNLWAWGHNRYGSRGDNTSNCCSISCPVQITPGGIKWKTISANLFNSAGIKQDGTIWAWGYNKYCQLGTVDTASRSSPVQLSTAETNWKCVVVGPYSNLGINSVGDTTIWGKQVGCVDFTFITCYDPIFVWGCAPNTAITGCNAVVRSPLEVLKTALPNATNTNWTCISSHGISGGCRGYGVLGPPAYLYCCQNSIHAIRCDGTLWAWGCNRWGQLGNSSQTNSFTSMVPVCSNNTNWCFVCGYGEFSGGITSSGNLWMWGRNRCGNLGDNTTISRSSPVQTITGGTNWCQFSASRRTTAAIKTDGTLWTWGSGECGALGDSFTGTSRSSPSQTVVLGSNWSCVSSGFFGFIALKGGGIWSWGNNACGNLGDTIIASKPTPAEISFASSGWASVSGESWVASALKNDGTIWTWGCVGFRSGNGTYVSGFCGSPVQALGNNWCKLSASNSVTIAQKTDGSIWAWGDSAMLGANFTVSQCSPVQIITPTQGSSWKDFNSGSRNYSASVGIRCCSQCLNIVYCGTIKTCGYNNIKTASISDKHAVFLRFIGDET